MLTRTAEMLQQRNQQSAGAAAVMGGTNESLAADREANAKTMADAASQIVIAGEQRKDNIENQYRERDQQLSEQINALKGQKKSGFDIASDALGGAASGAMSGMGLG
jgi:1,2-phenylacetyl-CoA epoxidase catalytic subunit